MHWPPCVCLILCIQQRGYLECNLCKTLREWFLRIDLGKSSRVHLVVPKGFLLFSIIMYLNDCNGSHTVKWCFRYSVSLVFVHFVQNCTRVFVLLFIEWWACGVWSSNEMMVCCADSELQLVDYWNLSKKIYIIFECSSEIDCGRTACRWQTCIT